MGPKCRSLCLAAGLLLGFCVSAADSLNDVESLLQQHLVQDPTPDSDKDAPQEAATPLESAPVESAPTSAPVESAPTLPEKAATQPESAPVESAPTSAPVESAPTLPEKANTSSPMEEEEDEEPETPEPLDEIGPIGEEVNTTQTTRALPSATERISNIVWDMLFNPLSVPAIRGKAARGKAVDGDYVIDMSVDEYLADQARALADEGVKELFKQGLKEGRKLQKSAGHLIKHKVLDMNVQRKNLSRQLKRSVLQEIQTEKVKAIKKFVKSTRGARNEDTDFKTRMKKKVRQLADSTLKPFQPETRPKKVLTSQEQKRKDHRAAIDEWHKISSEQREEKRRMDSIHHAKIEHDQAEKELLHPNIWPQDLAPGHGYAEDDGVKEEEEELKKVEEEEQEKKAGADTAAKEKAPNPPTEQPPPQ